MNNNQDLKNTYNKIAGDWHNDHKEDDWWIEGTDKFISNFKKGDAVLDVGCAGGTKSKYMTDRGLNVTGMDFSEELIKIAEKEIPAVKFIVLDMYNIDQLLNKFDGIFVQAVLLHAPKKDVPNIFKMMVSKLKDGGYLYVAVKEKRINSLDEEIKKEDDYGYEYERFFSYFTMEEMKDYFKNAGLSIVYENFNPPNQITRNTNWMQIIGKK